MRRPWKIGIIIASSLLALLMIAVVVVCYDLFVDKGIAADLEVVEVEKVGYYYKVTVKVTNPGDQEIMVFNGGSYLVRAGGNEELPKQRYTTLDMEWVPLSGGMHIMEQVVVHESCAHQDMQVLVATRPKGDPQKLLPYKIGNLVEERISATHAPIIENFLDRNYLELRSSTLRLPDIVTKVSDSPLVKEAIEALSQSDEIVSALRRHPGYELVKAFSENRHEDVSSLDIRKISEETDHASWKPPKDLAGDALWAFRQFSVLVADIIDEVNGRSPF